MAPVQDPWVVLAELEGLEPLQEEPEPLVVRESLAVGLEGPLEVGATGALEEQEEQEGRLVLREVVALVLAGLEALAGLEGPRMGPRVGGA